MLWKDRLRSVKSTILVKISTIWRSLTKCKKNIYCALLEDGSLKKYEPRRLFKNSIEYHTPRKEKIHDIWKIILFLRMTKTPMINLIHGSCLLRRHALRIKENFFRTSIYALAYPRNLSKLNEQKCFFRAYA